MRKLSVALSVSICVLFIASAAHAKTIFGTNGTNFTFGTKSGDLLNGGPFTDLQFGKNSAASGSAAQRFDTLKGQGGNDFMHGGSRKDILDGGTGSDLLIDEDGTSADVLNGGDDGDGIFSLDGAADIVDCGQDMTADFVIADPIDSTPNCLGPDTISTTDGPVSFRGATVLDVLDATANDASGTAANDLIAGLAGNDQIAGLDGNDVLFGGKGKDIILGQGNDDILTDDDGTGGDLIAGGPGLDQIYAADGAVDTINCGFDTDRDDVFADPADKLQLCDSNDVVVRFNGVNVPG